MLRGFGDWIGLLFVVALIYVLVRPQSGAGQLVDGITGFLVSIVQAATDLASPSAQNTGA